MLPTDSMWPYDESPSFAGPVRVFMGEAATREFRAGVAAGTWSGYAPEGMTPTQGIALAIDEPHWAYPGTNDIMFTSVNQFQVVSSVTLGLMDDIEYEGINYAMAGE